MGSKRGVAAGAAHTSGASSEEDGRAAGVRGMQEAGAGDISEARTLLVVASTLHIAETRESKKEAREGAAERMR